MGTCGQLKREFVKKWSKGLQTYTSSDMKMSFLERKNVIKLSADLAMASTRINANTMSTSWSCVLIAKAKTDNDNAALIENILGPADEKLKKKLRKCSSSQVLVKRVRSKKILKRSCGIRKRARKMAPRQTTVLATCVAKRLVKKRTKVLKSLVPGGESMGEISLIKETLDYIISLRAQVDVMRRLANATDLVLNRKKMIDDSAS